jgi:predicted RND superfamily exporter protein
MIIRFGLTSPQHFPTMGPGIEEIKRDLAPFMNLSTGTWEEAGEEEEDKPLNWVMLTGRPVTRFVASDKMQSEMQSSLLLGSLFVLTTLSIGFRSVKQAFVSLTPILLVVVWLYGLIYALGYSLNIVTVTIATISLGVGIDYCIHVTERYREEKEKGANHVNALHGVGGACALALIGSAVSDIAGFSIIATSSMGLFNTFGLFSAMMILLSLIASMVLTTAALGIVNQLEERNRVEEPVISESL